MPEQLERYTTPVAMGSLVDRAFGAGCRTTVYSPRIASTGDVAFRIPRPRLFAGRFVQTIETTVSRAMAGRGY